MRISRDITAFKSNKWSLMQKWNDKMHQHNKENNKTAIKITLNTKKSNGNKYWWIWIGLNSFIVLLSTLKSIVFHFHMSRSRNYVLLYISHFNVSEIRDFFLATTTKKIVQRRSLMTKSTARVFIVLKTTN